MLLQRSLLFVPGNRPELLEKAGRFSADVLCLDLEESVPPDDKSSARDLVRDAVARLSGEGRTVHVRVNSTASGLTRDDLAAVVQSGLAGVLLAKTQSAQHVRQIDVLLREQELAHDVKPGTVELIAAIESAQALLRCEEISHASTRLVALMLGGEDFTFDLGVARTRDADELTYARSHVATCARAAGLSALDTPWVEIEDIEGLEADSRRARTLGFAGKYAIHPSHLDAIHRVFTPSDEEVAAARTLLERWDAAVARGDGVVQLDGRMVDGPIAERARALIERATAARGG